MFSSQRLSPPLPLFFFSLAHGLFIVFKVWNEGEENQDRNYTVEILSTGNYKRNEMDMMDVEKEIYNDLIFPKVNHLWKIFLLSEERGTQSL